MTWEGVGRMIGFVCLQTDRLTLRDHREEDLPEHHRLLSDPEVMRYLPELFCRSREESARNLREAMEEIGREGRTRWFLRIEDRTTGEQIGEMGYTVTKVTPEGSWGHIGYFLRRRFWGKGYASEALEELLRFAFEEGGACRMTTGCLVENAGSERVMQKCGFQKERTIERGEFHEGSWKERVEYSLEREMWKKRRGPRPEEQAGG